MARGELPHVQRIAANLNGSVKAFRAHKKLCATCRNAAIIKRPEKSCDTGWQWVKDIHRFTRQLERARDDQAGQLPGQLALW